MNIWIHTVRPVAVGPRRSVRRNSYVVTSDYLPNIWPPRKPAPYYERRPATPPESQETDVQTFRAYTQLYLESGGRSS